MLFLLRQENARRGRTLGLAIFYEDLRWSARLHLSLAGAGLTIGGHSYIKICRALRWEEEPADSLRVLQPERFTQKV